MDLIPQHIRITNYKKLIDRFITSQARTSSDPEKNQMGRIFALIEILNPWHPNAQIGQTIINTLVREYYKQSNSNELINFENALKKVNEKLVEITQRGETDWIGKINACLVLVTKGKIHLAYTGKIKAYLWRSKKILPIINPKETYTYNHPLKTFSSVISGDLKLKDKIFFSTNLLFDFINSSKLEQILSEQDIAQIGAQIANILKSRNTKQANCILIEMGIVRQEETQLPEVIYLDQEQFVLFSQSLKKSFTNLKKSGVAIGAWFGKIFGKSQVLYRDKILPKGKNLIVKSKEYTQKHLIKNKDYDRQKQTLDKPEHPKPSLNINYYNTSSKKFILYLKKALDCLGAGIRKIFDLLRLAFKPKNRSKTFIIIAAVLIVIFIANIGYLKRVNKNRANATKTEQILTNLENKRDDVSLALITGDDEKAQNLLAEIQTELMNLNYDNSFEERVAALKKEVQEKLDKLSQITRLDQPQSSKVFENADLFTYLNDEITTVSSSNNKILSSSTDNDSTPVEIVQIPTSSGLAKTLCKKDNQAFIYTFQKSLYLLDGKDLNVLNNKDNSWENADAMANFSDNIYLLDAGTGQINKYTQEGEEFSQANEYIDPSTIDIKQGVDLAIDGYIYVLKKDGSIVKILLGKLDNFNLSGIPEPSSTITNPKKIYTDENIDSLYVLDGNRILELDKSGKFISQFAFSDEITDIKDFYINPNEKVLYVLNDNKIYKYNY